MSKKPYSEDFNRILSEALQKTEQESAIDDKTAEAITNFMWISHYNGYLEEVNDIYETLKNSNGYGIKRPEKWKQKPDYGVHEFCGIFWSWLVLMFGDYGTSPRFGWIEKQNAECLIMVFDEFKKDCDFTNKDEWKV